MVENYRVIVTFVIIVNIALSSLLCYLLFIFTKKAYTEIGHIPHVLLVVS
jgi:hypothetical protein